MEELVTPERSAGEQRLVDALRATFDASVMNFGSYNILYGRNVAAAVAQGRQEAIHQDGSPDAGGTSIEETSAGSVQERVSGAPHLLVGYRRAPVEMVLCPVELEQALHSAASDPPHAAEPQAAMPLPVNLTNLAGMAAEGQSVEISLSTGHRVVLDVQSRIGFKDLPGVELNQEADVADFFEFLDFFFDTVEEMNH